MPRLTYKDMVGQAWVGRNDGRALRVKSKEDAAEILAIVQRSDPEGVERGDYYIETIEDQQQPVTDYDHMMSGTEEGGD